MRQHPSARAKNQGQKTQLMTGQSQANGWQYTQSDDDDSGKWHEYPYIVEEIVDSTSWSVPQFVFTWSVPQFVKHSTISLYESKFLSCFHPSCAHSFAVVSPWNTNIWCCCNAFHCLVCIDFIVYLTLHLLHPLFVFALLYCLWSCSSYWHFEVVYLRIICISIPIFRNEPADLPRNHAAFPILKTDKILQVPPRFRWCQRKSSEQRLQK